MARLTVKALPTRTARARLTTSALDAILIPTAPAQRVKGRITFTHLDKAGTGGGQ